MDNTTYHLRLTFTEPLLGTQAQRDIATQYMQSKAREAALAAVDELETLPEMIRKGTTTFHRLDGRLLLYDYHLKGFLKESAQVQNGVNGVKALRSKVDNLLFVTPRRIDLHLPRGCDVAILERPLRAQTPQGPRTAIARSEMVPEGTWFEATLHVLDGPITQAILRALLDYGAYRGMGQWRGGSYGRFKYTLRRR